VTATSQTLSHIHSLPRTTIVLCLYLPMVSISKESSISKKQRLLRYLPRIFTGAVVTIVFLLYYFLAQTTTSPRPLLIPQQVAGVKASSEREQLADKLKDNKASVLRGAEVNKLKAPAEKVVVCGAHSASSCVECPQGHGESWCHGDCVWCADKNECQDKHAYINCPECTSKALTSTQCERLGSQCSWCAQMEQCQAADAFCPQERPWLPPAPEPWFDPPQPIDKYGLTISVVLPCGSENEYFERTVKSVFAATPPEVLKEIVVVDDNSVPPLEPMFTLDKDEYKVKFVRSDVSLGLIDAKHQGALAATGDIVVFFDCHVKPALGYWEPFVRNIAENHKRVVVPAITALDVWTWKEFNRPTHATGGMSKCYITLDSAFKWTSDDKPWVPAMSGGLLAIARDWFFEVGGHDQAMKGWGGENIDLSLRIWRCGGEIVSAPTSYVAHMWRDQKTRAKYVVPPGSASVNRARALLAHAPEMFAQKTVDFPMFQSWKQTGGSDLDVSSIQSAMQNLDCKNFDWYLDFFSYIYRDGGVIPKEVFQISPDGGKTCLYVKSKRAWGSDGQPSDTLAMEPCQETKDTGTQHWHLANRNAQGKCCSSLRSWNTDQCIVGRLATSVCSMSGQPAQVTSDGRFKVGTRCLSVFPLRETSCEEATTTTWEKFRPFQPPEFEILGQDLKDKW